MKDAVFAVDKAWPHWPIHAADAAAAAVLANFAAKFAQNNVVQWRTTNPAFTCLLEQEQAVCRCLRRPKRFPLYHAITRHSAPT